MGNYFYVKGITYLLAPLPFRHRPAGLHLLVPNPNTEEMAGNGKSANHWPRPRHFLWKGIWRLAGTRAV